MGWRWVTGGREQEGELEHSSSVYWSFNLNSHSSTGATSDPIQFFCAVFLYTFKMNPVVASVILVIYSGSSAGIPFVLFCTWQASEKQLVMV